MQVSARYFDGKSGHPHEVVVTFGASGLDLKTADDSLKEYWSFKSIKVLELPYHGRPAIIGDINNGDCRLVIADEKFFAQLKPCLQNTETKHYSSRSRFSGFFWLIASIISIVILVSFISRFSILAANLVPYKWEQRLGRQVLDEILSGEALCENEIGLAALDKLANHLQKVSGSDIPFEVMVIRESESNAFAAPGGYIVFYSNLIDEAENQHELAGVLSHEMGHVIRHHPTQGLIRALGFYYALKLFFGDAGSGNTAMIASTLLNLGYNRDMEREADNTGIEIMKKANMDSLGLVKFFEKIRKKEGFLENSKIFSYFSTHPNTVDRMESIRKAGTIEQPQDILTEKEWSAIKAVCK